MSKKADLTKEILTHFWFASWYLFVLKKKKEFNQHNKGGEKRSSRGGNAPHSSFLAWEIPWTEEPGGLQALGSQSRTQLSTHMRLPAWPILPLPNHSTSGQGRRLLWAFVSSSVKLGWWKCLFWGLWWGLNKIIFRNTQGSSQARTQQNQVFFSFLIFLSKPVKGRRRPCLTGER